MPSFPGKIAKSLALYLLIPGMTLVGAPAAAAPSPAQESQSPMAWRGDQNGRMAPGAEVVTDAGHWNDLWRHLQRDTPPFDFTRSVAVVAYAGQCGTSGFSLQFLDPVLQGDDLWVAWMVVPPPPGSFNMQVITYPWEIQAFPRPKGRVIPKQGAFNY
jgi:hypothetical protein